MVALSLLVDFTNMYFPGQPLLAHGFLFLLAIGVGVVVHFYVEKPIRRVLIPRDCASACFKKIYSIQQSSTGWVRILKPLTSRI